MQEDVRAFHVKFHHHIEDRPTKRIPSEVLRLRARLIREEAEETCDALDRWADMLDALKGREDLEEHPILNDVYLEAIDGLADLTYVIEGTGVSTGVDVQQHAAEVHRANMTKEVGQHLPGEKYGPAGKGASFIPPNHARILATAG